ncbi:MAG: class I SAM-dependent methyltransferase [Acidimicrobiia bacterium]
MTVPDRRSWDRYIDGFHTRRPGITETVLGACRADGLTPYRWLATSVGGTDATLLDLACGSAPLAPILGPRSLGIDRSESELRLARARHPDQSLVRADASHLPLPDRSIDAVLCSLALMVLAPLEAVIDELARVSRSGGTLAVLLPSTSPLSARDRSRYARLAFALRARPAQFPNPAAMHDLHRLLEAGGYRVGRDDQVRFAYAIADDAAADALVDSFYLPNVTDERLAAGRRTARRWTGTDLGIPLRRVSATSRR